MLFFFVYVVIIWKKECKRSASSHIHSLVSIWLKSEIFLNIFISFFRTYYYNLHH